MNDPHQEVETASEKVAYDVLGRGRGSERFHSPKMPGCHLLIERRLVAQADTIEPDDERLALERERPWPPRVPSVGF